MTMQNALVRDVNAANGIGILKNGDTLLPENAHSAIITMSEDGFVDTTRVSFNQIDVSGDAIKLSDTEGVITLESGYRYKLTAQIHGENTGAGIGEFQFYDEFLDSFIGKKMTATGQDPKESGDQSVGNFLQWTVDAVSSRRQISIRGLGSNVAPPLADQTVLLIESVRTVSPDKPPEQPQYASIDTSNSELDSSDRVQFNSIDVDGDAITMPSTGIIELKKGYDYELSCQLGVEKQDDLGATFRFYNETDSDQFGTSLRPWPNETTLQFNGGNRLQTIIKLSSATQNKQISLRRFTGDMTIVTAETNLFIRAIRKITPESSTKNPIKVTDEAGGQWYFYPDGTCKAFIEVPLGATHDFGIFYHSLPDSDEEFVWDFPDGYTISNYGVSSGSKAGSTAVTGGTRFARSDSVYLCVTASTTSRDSLTLMFSLVGEWS